MLDFSITHGHQQITDFFVRLCLGRPKMVEDSDSTVCPPEQSGVNQRLASLNFQHNLPNTIFVTSL